MDPITQPLFASSSVSNGQTQLAVTYGTSPYVSVYPFSYNFGFGTKYSNPSTLPAGTRYGSCWSSQYSQKALALCGTGTPIIDVYRWTVSGFGTKYSDPGGGTVFGAGRDVTFIGSTSGDYAIALVTDNSDIAVWAWNLTTGFGTKYSNPSSGYPLPSFGYSVIHHTDSSGEYLIFGHEGSPYISAWDWSSSTGFGNKKSDPASALNSRTNGLTSKYNDTIFTANSSSPYINAYNFSNGFGTKWSDPGTLPTGTGNDVSVIGNFGSMNVFIAHSTSPYITAYSYGFSSFGSKWTNPGTLPTGTGNCVTARQLYTGSSVVVGHETTPFITAYPFSSSSGFGSKYSDPATLPPSGVISVSFSDRYPTDRN